MGAEVDGLAGIISVPKDKKFETAYFALWFLGQRMTAMKVRLMVLGRLVRCFEFRRPLMNLLQAIWPKDARVRKPVSMHGYMEILESVALLPMAGTDLRAQVDPAASCSDASEAGGGLCVSGALTHEGEQLLHKLCDPQFQATRTMAFQPLGAMRAACNGGPRILVVSLFDGVSALMVSLCRMRVQVILTFRVFYNMLSWLFGLLIAC